MCLSDAFMYSKRCMVVVARAVPIGRWPAYLMANDLHVRLVCLQVTVRLMCVRERESERDDETLYHAMSVYFTK